MPKPDLTIREKRLIKGVVSGLTGAEAARRAGYSAKSASQLASETLAKPKVQSALLAAMEKAGITDDRIAQVMDEGLKANRVVSARVTNKDAEVDTDDFIEVPDHAVRHKFLETAIDVKGAKAAKQVQLSGFDDLLRKLPHQVDSSKLCSRGWCDLGRNVRGGTWPRLSWGRSLL